MKRAIQIGFLFLLLVLGGCSSTRVTSVWKAPGATAAPFGKIMVVGIVRDTERAMREKMEGHLVDDLRTLGYNASSAFVQYGPKYFQNMAEADVNKKLKEEGIDAVLTIVLLDKAQERHYVPGRVVYSPYIVYHNRFWGYYQTIYNRIESPGYYAESTNYFWESNLYDLRTQTLLYSVQTKSFDPSSADALAHEYGKLIISQMTKDGVLTRRAGAVARGFSSGLLWTQPVAVSAGQKAAVNGDGNAGNKGS